MNYTTEKEILQDGKNKWYEKKVKTEFLAEIYKNLEKDRKSEKVFKCGTFLEFAKYKYDTKKIISSQFL